MIQGTKTSSSWEIKPCEQGSDQTGGILGSVCSFQVTAIRGLIPLLTIRHPQLAASMLDQQHSPEGPETQFVIFVTTAFIVISVPHPSMGTWVGPPKSSPWPERAVTAIRSNRGNKCQTCDLYHAL